MYNRLEYHKCEEVNFIELANLLSLGENELTDMRLEYI